MKIDVEELEIEVLMGGRVFLEKHSPDIILEILLNSDNNYKIFNYLKGFGYKGYLITAGGLIPTNIPLPIREKESNRTIYKNHYFSVPKSTLCVSELIAASIPSAMSL